MKDIRNYIKTSEAKNSQVTAQKLRDLVAGDSSFHSLTVTPSSRPSFLSHPASSLHQLFASQFQLLTRYFVAPVAFLLQLRHPCITLGGSSSPLPCTTAPRAIPSSLTRSRRLREKRVKTARIWPEPRKLNSQIYILDYRRLAAAGAEQHPRGGQEATLCAGQEGRVC